MAYLVMRSCPGREVIFNSVDYIWIGGEVRSNEIRCAGHMCLLHCPQSRVCTERGGRAAWSIFVISPLPVWKMPRMLRSRPDDRRTRSVRV